MNRRGHVLSLFFMPIGVEKVALQAGHLAFSHFGPLAGFSASAVTAGLCMVIYIAVYEKRS